MLSFLKFYFWYLELNISKRRYVDKGHQYCFEIWCFRSATEEFIPILCKTEGVLLQSYVTTKWRRQQNSLRCFLDQIFGPATPELAFQQQSARCFQAWKLDMKLEAKCFWTWRYHTAMWLIAIHMDLMDLSDLHLKDTWVTVTTSCFSEFYKLCEEVLPCVYPKSITNHICRKQCGLIVLCLFSCLLMLLFVKWWLWILVFGVKKKNFSLILKRSSHHK